MDRSIEGGEPHSSGGRVYRNEHIAVYWEPKVCIHSGLCVRGLPEVFQPAERPWVKIDAATADRIAEVVSRCPSGALHFERFDGGPQEAPAEEVSITPQKDGPLYVRGRLRIVGADGALRREDIRMALCGCGRSNNNPFCDNSH